MKKCIVESIETVKLPDISKSAKRERTEIGNAAEDYFKRETKI